MLLDAAGQRAERSKAELDSLKEEIDSLFKEITEGRSGLWVERTENKSRRSTLDFLLNNYRAAVAAIDAGLENSNARLEQTDNDWERRTVEGIIAGQENYREYYLDLIEDTENEIVEIEI